MAKKQTEKRVKYRAGYRVLAYRILTVAVEGFDNDWSAYVGIVNGENYDEEWTEVRDNGDKLPQDVVEVLFPDFKDLKWRD